MANVAQRACWWGFVVVGAGGRYRSAKEEERLPRGERIGKKTLRDTEVDFNSVHT